MVDRWLRGGQEGRHFLRVQGSSQRRAGGWRGHPVRRIALQKLPINRDPQDPVQRSIIVLHGLGSQARCGCRKPSAVSPRSQWSPGFLPCRLPHPNLPSLHASLRWIRAKATRPGAPDYPVPPQSWRRPPGGRWRAWACWFGQRASGGTQKMLWARYSSGSSGSAPWSRSASSLA